MILQRITTWVVGMLCIVGGCVWVMNSPNSTIYMPDNKNRNLEILTSKKGTYDTIVNGDTLWVPIDTAGTYKK